MLTSRILKSIRLSLVGATLFLCLAYLSAQVAFAEDDSPLTAVDDSLITTATTAETTSADNIFVDNGGIDSQVVYLSDIPFSKAQVGWGNLTLDKNGVNNGGLTLKVNGSTTTFKKGIFAHATSTVEYDISQYNTEYPYFVTYYGSNTTNNNNGNGVKFYIYTSRDGQNWDLQTEAEPPALKCDDGARQVKIDIRGVKYIRLYANDNGSDASDHAVWADTKLVREGYKDNIVRTVEDLDTEIMAKYQGGPVPEDLHLLLLQRTLINNVGQYGLRTFVEGSAANRTMLEWFLNDEEALRLWTMGGSPSGSYLSSLQVLSNLYAAHKDDLQDNTELNGVRNGSLYLRMMLSLSLTHASAVNLWIWNNQTSNAVTRYEIYKDMYLNNKLEKPVMFANLTVNEMRGVMQNQIDDESILWLRDYTAKSPGGNQLGERFNPYHYIHYTLGYSYGAPQYYAPANYATWDAKYNLSQYHITYRSGNPKLWIVFEQGAVCGGLSKTAANIHGAWGYPASPVGQPGHCAYIYMYDAGGGKNAWQLANSIVANGWANTGPAYVPYGWGGYSGNVTNNGTIKSSSYIFLSQECQNEYEKFEQANMLMLMTRVYRNDWDKLVQIYNDAYDQEHINLDVWNGLVTIALDSRTGSTQEDLYNVAAKCAEDLKYHPLPMYDLTRRIGARITDPVVKAKFMMLVQSTLENASRANSSQSIQAKEINAVANALLGVVDNRLATFSFDGGNANKLILARAFQGAGVAWEYSLDGGKTWTSSYADSVTLTPQQIASITADNDIKVHIIGAPREGNTFTIDITQPWFSGGLSPNDDENRIYGTSNLMVYYISEDINSNTVPADATWTSFATAPNLEGDKRLFVRNRATGTQLATNYVWYTFNKNVINEERNYIKPAGLTIAATSPGSGAWQNMLDGNPGTNWRSSSGRMPAFITIKLDEPRYVNSLEFVYDSSCKLFGAIPNGRPQAINVYTSMDGSTWKKVTSQGWGNDDSLKTANFAPSRALYVKLECTNSFDTENKQKRIACADIKLYEDLAVDPTPRAKVRYDISSKTNHDVVAELVDINKPITVTNTENGAITHTFTENGSFTFEFVDEEGNEGHAKADVNWIDKTAPEMNVSYSTTDPTNGDVVVSMTFNEPAVITTRDISILNADGSTYEGEFTLGPKTITFTENDSNDIEFVDQVGNVGHKTITVDWIDREEPTGTVTYSTTDITDQAVVATVEPNEEGVSVTSEGGETHTFDSNGEFTFELVDAAGNVGTATANVFWIKQTPKVNVDFSIASGKLTKDPVDVVIELPEGYRIMNNDGKSSYTFNKSGEFAFQYLDPDGMQGSYPVKVDWIDCEAPLATLTYDEPTATNKNVTATLSLEDQSETRVTNAGGATHVFTDNGEFTFEFEDALGNKGTHTAKVDWIDRISPTAEVRYNTTSQTSKSVVATLVPSEPITILNTEGVDVADDGTITHTFTKNGEFIFGFQDAAKNGGMATAKVTWIDATAPGEVVGPGDGGNSGGDVKPGDGGNAGGNVKPGNPGSPDGSGNHGNASGSGGAGNSGGESGQGGAGTSGGTGDDNASNNADVPTVNPFEPSAIEDVPGGESSSPNEENASDPATSDESGDAAQSNTENGLKRLNKRDAATVDLNGDSAESEAARDNLLAIVLGVQGAAVLAIGATFGVRRLVLKKRGSAKKPD